ncbi:MAG TPA: adenylate kinase [Candidatus Limnocylindrales bacterium]|nr:adenylate kinase [Candidatus Limnocylindrales bacterium]
MNLLLYGAPGSGKGTQANMLRAQFGIPHIATGDMLRAEIQAGTELGRQAQPILAAGKYVSDDIMIGMIRNRLRRPDCEPGFIIDGFPRTVPQAEALDGLMVELGKRFDRVIYLMVPVEELLSRLSGRLVCPRCQRTYPPLTSACEADGGPLVQREDDRPEAVRPRIEIYLEKTVPVLDHYRGEGLVSEIDGRGSIEEISRQVLNAVAPSNGQVSSPLAGKYRPKDGDGEARTTQARQGKPRQGKPQ